MAEKLYWNTVNPLLQSGLEKFMAEPLFDPFRLVGGTSLSLQIGHRMSIDIDLFTDAPYGSLDFAKIDRYLRDTYNYVSPAKLPDIVGMGISYIVGSDPEDSFKLDLFYTIDPFIYQIINSNSIRLASKQEIAAMKMDVVQRGGRKKDFWDIHALMDQYTLADMVRFHEERYPYSHDGNLLNTNLTNFATADEDFDPVCLLGKHWEIIKLDIVDTMYGVQG
jgi:hypothetical protein